jgi:hypothetical protein
MNWVGPGTVTGSSRVTSTVETNVTGGTIEVLVTVMVEISVIVEAGWVMVTTEV